MRLPITTLNLLCLAISMRHVDAQNFNEEVPSSPPTTQFVGPESGFIPNIPEGNGPQINQDRVVDFSSCFGFLGSNDRNGDGQLSRTEFENFAQQFGDTTECLGPLSEVPLELVTVFNQLSCECRVRGGPADCCLQDNAQIPVTGVSIQDPFIVSEQQFLRQVCLRTDQAIVTWCAPPPPPIIPPPPPAVIFRSGVQESRNGLIVGLIFAGLFLLLPWRRRWIFCAENKEEEEEPEPEPDVEAPSVPPPVASVPPPDDEAADRAEPDDNVQKLASAAAEEDGEFGGTSYGRTIEEPEYEEEGKPKKFVYQQFEKPQEEPDPLKLKPIPGKTKTEEDEPYDLEHYVPDGGIVQYEREGEWRYDADGGWTPEERAKKDPTEWEHKKYERAAVLASTPDDNRRQRNLEAYDGGAVFAVLDQASNHRAAAATNDMFDWVIQSTLDTLDDRVDDLQGSIHTESSSEVDSKSKASGEIA